MTKALMSLKIFGITTRWQDSLNLPPHDTRDRRNPSIKSRGLKWFGTIRPTAHSSFTLFMIASYSIVYHSKEDSP